MRVGGGAFSAAGVVSGARVVKGASPRATTGRAGAGATSPGTQRLLGGGGSGVGERRSRSAGVDAWPPPAMHRGGAASGDGGGVKRRATRGLSTAPALADPEERPGAGRPALPPPLRRLASRVRQGRAPQGSRAWEAVARARAEEARRAGAAKVGLRPGGAIRPGAALLQG